MMDILCRILGTMFLLLFACVILVQWYAIIARFFTRPERRKNFSLIPLIGGAIGCLSLWFFPETREKDIYWVPFFLDPGSVLLAVSLFLSPFTRLFSCGKQSSAAPGKDGGGTPNE